MSSVAVKSTFVIFILFVALDVRLSYAQDASSAAQTSSGNTSVCGEDEFQCQSQECIQYQFLCDGRADCSDLSDETEYECAKPELSCPKYGFRCTYGACIDIGLLCDGSIDCIADASDENPEACPPPAAMAPGTGGAFSGGPSNSDYRPGQTCFVPFPPTNGQLKLRKFIFSGVYEDVDPSFIAELNSLLIYSCAPGYRLRGSAQVRCEQTGTWSRKPVCIEIQCRPLGSLSMGGYYTDVNGRVTPCDNVIPVHIKTTAQVMCRPGYRKSTEVQSPGDENVECSEAGKWMPEPISCVPVCGITDRNHRPIQYSGSTVNIGTLPWHAELYVQRNSSDNNETIFRCSATIIRANLLLTAAHCLYDSNETAQYIYNSSIKGAEVLEDFLVVTGNVRRDDRSPHHHEPVRVHKVKNIHTTCRFYDKAGYFAMDIALIELQDSLEFSNTLLPACVDEIGTIRETLLFGRDSCADEQVHDGGGLLYKMNDIWYVFGIVSQAASVKADGSEPSCNSSSQFHYTKVANHIRWIRQVISDLEHSKYPPCSRYLPPFHKSPTIMTTTTTTTTEAPISSPMTTESSITDYFGPMDHACLVPPQPVNGEWRLHRDFCKTHVDCKVPLGTAVLGLGRQLVYSCAPGYKAKGSTDVYCRANGNWSAIPDCIEITCRPINSVSTIATCFRVGESVDCNHAVSPNTTAQVSCRAGYEASTTLSDTLQCNTDGDWEPELSMCVPACGATFHQSRTFSEGEITAEADNLPWQATLYVQRITPKRNRKEVLCGATLIQPNLLLTAAHCVYNGTTKTIVDPKTLFILMSNVHRQYDSPLHNSHSVRRGAVKNVHVYCDYIGLEDNYVSDIALLELHEPFEFFNMQLHPACLDFPGYHKQILGESVSGRIIGFGKTATGFPSDVLESISVPYVSRTQCKSSNANPETEPFINHDKFCAGYNNGTAICLGNGGGGLFVQIHNLWHLIGIASVDIGANAGKGEDTCDGNSYTLYTKVSDYMAWILDVMFHLERQKPYPPCGPEPMVPVSNFARSNAYA